MKDTLKRPEVLLAVGNVRIGNRLYPPLETLFLCVGGMPSAMSFEPLKELPDGVVEECGRKVRKAPDVPKNYIYDTDLHSDCVTTEKDNYVIYDELFDRLEKERGCLVWNVHGRECLRELADYEMGYADDWLVPDKVKKVLTNWSETVDTPWNPLRPQVTLRERVGGDVWVCIDGECHLVKDGIGDRITLKQEIVDAVYKKTGMNILENK